MTHSPSSKTLPCVTLLLLAGCDTDPCGPWGYSTQIAKVNDLRQCLAEKTCVLSGAEYRDMRYWERRLPQCFSQEIER
jgi:hypothetical protein